MIRNKIRGAKAFYQAAQQGNAPSTFEGFEVIDDHTVRIYLDHPASEFPTLLGQNAFYIYPQEAFEKYGKDLATNPVGTGAFRVQMFKPNEMAVLERNPEYYLTDENGNQLPYLDAVYDSLYLQAIKETNEEKRKSLYIKLDQILVEDAVVMPIYYEEFTRLIPIYVKNFPQNSIEYRDLSKVCFDPEFMPAS